MSNIVKTKILKLAVLTLVLGHVGFSALAADIGKKLVMPKHENCTTAEYLSNQWNVDTKRAKANDVLAYKKLICKTGREAFVLIWQEDKKPAYKLVDHSNYKISENATKMCVIVDKYCNQ